MVSSFKIRSRGTLTLSEYEYCIQLPSIWLNECCSRNKFDGGCFHNAWHPDWMQSRLFLWVCHLPGDVFPPRTSCWRQASLRTGTARQVSRSESGNKVFQVSPCDVEEVKVRQLSDTNNKNSSMIVICNNVSSCIVRRQQSHIRLNRHSVVFLRLYKREQHLADFQKSQ